MGDNGKHRGHEKHPIEEVPVRALDTEGPGHSPPPLNGYELVALNGSGNIYIDKSTDVKKDVRKVEN